MSQGAYDVNTIFGLWPRREVDTNLLSLLRLARRAGIASLCSLSTRGIFYDARAGNSETLAAARRHSSIIPVATFDLRDPPPFEVELHKLKKQGFKLVRVFREYQGWPIEYRPFQDLLRALAQVRLPLYVTISNMGELTCLDKNLWTCAFPLIVGGVNASFAPLFAEAIAVASSREHIYFETSRFDSVDAYELFAEKLGATRLLFGSGAPLYYPQSALNALTKSTLNPKDRELILHKNLQRILQAE